jgi:hypothetical protein
VDTDGQIVTNNKANVDFRRKQKYAMAAEGQKTTVQEF